jgi:peptidoglycan-associated lipoprotein
MRKNLWLGVVLLLIVPGLLFTASCAQKAVTAEPADKMAEDEAAKKAAEEAKKAEMAKIKEDQLRAEGLAGDARDQFEKELIHFDFDRSNLKPEAQEILRRKAEYLRKYPNVNVIIEGHCDERGTTEYNLALGDRRANSAKAFLVNLGIDDSRMTTISYGEERPLDPAQNETAWALNRRDQFVIE